MFHLDRGGKLPEQTSTRTAGPFSGGSAVDQPQLPGMPYPAVTQVTVRLGIVPETNHGQWQLESFNPVTGELLAMASKHHFDLDSYGPEAARIVLRLSEMIRAAVDGAGGGSAAGDPT